VFSAPMILASPFDILSFILSSCTISESPCQFVLFRCSCRFVFVNFLIAISFLVMAFVSLLLSVCLFIFFFWSVFFSSPPPPPAPPQHPPTTAAKGNRRNNPCLCQ